MIPRTHPVPAVLAAALLSAPAGAAITIYNDLAAWRGAVGGPTIARNPSDYFSGGGQPVNPEIWADVGVHLVSSGPLLTDFFPGNGTSIRSQIGQSFEVRWDTPITALWYRVQSPIGSVGFFMGDTYLGFNGDGEWGITSSQPFNRLVISLPQADWYGHLLKIEWGPVPGPGGLAPLALGAVAGAWRRRRA